MKVVEQYSVNKGEIIRTKFDNGQSCYHSRNGYKGYSSKPNARGLVRSLYPDTNPETCALMDKLAAAGLTD